MACRFPLAAFQLANGEVVFRERQGQNPVRSLFLPCGRCAMCRLERSRQWAVRCMHEARMHDASMFITLTYDDAHLPVDRSLKYSDYVAFMKRLRKYASRIAKSDVSVSKNVRFYMVGEYGGLTGRPHFHALIFGLDFADKLYFKRSGKSSVYTSATLRKLWPLGNHWIGAVTFESAAYCARYCMDKVTGDIADAHYRFVDQETGEIFQRVPEFNRMSLKPGIGATFLERFWSDVYPRGEVVVNGRKAKAPRYYDKMFRRASDGDAVARLEFERYERAMRVDARESSDERLAVREQVMLARLAFKSRALVE